LHGLGKIGARLTANVFDEMGTYWAEMAEQNQTEKQLQFLKTQLKPDGCILDLACGTGRHTIPLSQQGFNIVGLDISSKLLKIAKQCFRGVQLVRGDIRFLPFKTEAFTAAISMDTSLGYLPSESDDAQSLKEVRWVLKQKGAVVVDVFNRKNLTAKYHGKTPPAKTKEYPSFFLIQKRRVSDDSDWLCDSWIVRDKACEQVRVFEHTVRLYELESLQRLLESGGFIVNQVYGGYENERFSWDSDRLILIANAK
jgi:ubiquinone/menaquinone biosynthesis C-methylase UbiE